MVRISSLLIGLAVVIVLGGGIIWSGIYNVAATVPHYDVTTWFFGVVRDQSIVRHSGDVTVPDLDDPKLVDRGFQSYHQMCLTCHAAPGRKASVIREGLNPKPPKLDKEQTQSRTDAELFWIVTHGIKMTGMPAFGPTHENEELWALVAFLRTLPDISPDDYHQMVYEAGLRESPGVHAHDEQHGQE